MLRCRAVTGALLASMLVACGHSGYALKPVPRIAAESVGKPIQRLREDFGVPRKIDTTPTKLVYVWFLEQKPDGAPVGLHGCELEVSVDARSERILGFASSNIGWGRCAEIERRVRIADR